jgi:hypothetical protein
LPESKTEFYGEFGRNDHSQNLQDLLLEPEHARAYIFGGRKIFVNSKKRKTELFMEVTQLQNPATIGVRDLEGWYTHYEVRHGYTNVGQVIGAGIGSGSNSQTLGINWLKGINSTGFFVERVVRNNDFYYSVFTSRRDFGAHWVDLSANFNKSWYYKKFIYVANLSLIRTLNYQWRYNNQMGNRDVNNIHASFSFSYLL